MENFIVSARKYRPSTFKTVVGQDSITRTLKNAIKNNQLAQAFLFCGPRGVGKTTCARILAKTINCKNLSDSIEACDQCESCTSFNKSASFNIHELDAASNNSVDDIRSLVEQVRIPPQVGKYKVYIIDEVHMLSQQAFNAFLKTLEEPPAYAKFILATTEKHKIIPTILSRCQIFDFKRIGIDDIAGYLSFVAENEGVDAEVDALHIIAQKADGALRDALSMFDQIVSFAGKNLTYQVVIENLNVLDYDYYFRIINYLLQQNISDTLLVLNQIIDSGFDGQHFIIGMGEHLRNLLVCKDPKTVDLLEVGANIKNQYLDQATHCSVEFLIRSLDIINRCDINYKSSNNKRLHLELSLIQMANLNTEKHLDEVITTQVKPKPATSKPSSKTISSLPSEKDSKFRKPLKSGESKSKPVTGTGLSIKEIASRKDTEETDDSAETNGIDKRNEDFSQDDVNKIWNELLEKHLSDSPNLKSTLQSNKPVLKDNYVLDVSLNNRVQEDKLNREKSSFLSDLRSRLRNDHINFNILIEENNKELKPYTPHEKFKKMAQKNPNLAKMRDQLDLEIDF